MFRRVWSAPARRLALRLQEGTNPTAVLPAQADAGEGGLRLVSDPHRVDRPLMVRPGTLAVLLTTDRAPELRFPGDLLRPRLSLPGRFIEVLVVSTGPVRYEVTVLDLVTQELEPVGTVGVQVGVQLSDADDYAGLLDLVTETGIDLEAHLMTRVREEVAAALQGLVQVNRLADLRRLDLGRVLGERWLPRSFVSGILTRRDVTVSHVDWPPYEPEYDFDSPGPEDETLHGG